MSRFFSNLYSSLIPYVPGEQPLDRKYLKLNTNESPFPPAPDVIAAVVQESLRLNLYSDPTARVLRWRMAKTYEVMPSQIVLSNGSDEVLNFAFMAFASERRPLVFPDVTYGFYSVIAELTGFPKRVYNTSTYNSRGFGVTSRSINRPNVLPYMEIPVKNDLSIDPNDYLFGGRPKTIVIANPNAPTGLALSRDAIEFIVVNNPQSVVIVDEAYIDFGGESVVPLTRKYSNLLVIGTFSKSRSMAGARLGFAIGSSRLIQDLNTIRNSVNPYNVNRMTLAAGVAALNAEEYYKKNCEEIIRVRGWAREKLLNLGFEVIPSQANFLFVQHPEIAGRELYIRLREEGVLVRHFDKPRIENYNRITIGKEEQMAQLLNTIFKILKRKGVLK